MTIEGVDFANERPNAGALGKAGKRFVVRYLSPNTVNNPGKRLTAAEVLAYRAAGLAIAVVWETTTTRATQGRAAGVADAKAAVSVAKGLGFPADQPIYFAVDDDLTGVTVADYFRGVSSVISVSRTGVYGGLKPVKYLLDSKIVKYAWQTYAWSGQPPVWDPRAQCQQYHNGASVVGMSLDLCRAMVADYGQWPASSTTASTSEAPMAHDPLDNNDANTIVHNPQSPGGGVRDMTAADPATAPPISLAGAIEHAQQYAIAAAKQSAANATALSTLSAAVAKIPTTAVPAASLSDADVQRIAGAVVDLLDKRLAS